ncbi:c-type cytochrome [Histidinibacterium aquaticum]|nr:c-type cytochrome [Histidinibacterium aquaticum]
MPPAKTTRCAAVGLVTACGIWIGPAASIGQNALLSCPTCHTAAPSDDDRIYPILNGQPAPYIARQLEAYREGLREHPQMQATAHALGPEGAIRQAKTYGDMPRPALQRSEDFQPVPDAERLVLDGDWSRGLPPCASCHGAPASEPPLVEQGFAREAPYLHGQPENYLALTLEAYAEGARKSDPMGRMRAFAEQLTPAERGALAQYYSSWEIIE